MKGTVRWGILGTGSIAHKFAQAVKNVEGAEPVAVGSRKQETAEAFGDEFAIPHRHGSYEALVRDPDLDAIYVSTPHPFHREATVLCLKAGKHVLCEKPFAMNAGEAKEMIDVARTTKRFLMEAMWTRFLPLSAKVRELVADGTIGQVRMARADFCFRAQLNPKGRLFAPELGGGGLLDVGCYTISYANMIFGGTPDRIASMADLGETGVDEQAALVLGYGAGRMAVLTCAVRTTTPHEALILGTDGMIRVHHPFWHGTSLTLSIPGKEDVQMSHPYVGNGFECEIAEAGRCIRAGKTESEIMPLDETLSIIKVMDRIRAQWGLKYPME